MIHVDMPEPSGPEWQRIKAAAIKEREEAILHFAHPSNVGFEFSVYSDKELKRILNRLFHEKCCYCESVVEVTHPIDTEHFRPKAAVYDTDLTAWPHEIKWVKVQGHEGYYWLAGSWLNLLPSCIDCNRSRSHTSPGGEEEVTGKANKFPLHSGRRGTLPGEEIDEVPLLLHPHYDSPEEHLEFLDNGWVEGKTVKGAVSIVAYGLKRPGLVIERAKRLRPVKGRLDSIRRKIVLLDEVKGNTELKQYIESELEYEFQELCEYLAEDKPYLCMARKMVRDSLAEYLSPEQINNRPRLADTLELASSVPTGDRSHP
jgi:hypothetical protein